jgi:hypothetical protein
MTFAAPSTSMAPRAGGAARHCACGATITRRSKRGLCRSCAALNRQPNPGHRKPKTKRCLDCDTLISDMSKGRCRTCANIYFNRLPETIEKRKLGWKKRLADPEKYEQLCRVAKRNSQKAMADPEKRAAASERARHIYALYLNTPEARAKVAASRSRAGDKIREMRLAWCPPEYRELHRENVYSHRMLASQSREMIEKLVANDRAMKDVDSALDYLLKFAPVQKLENGFRYGNAILSPAELVSRAKVRGWEPERWAA